MAYREPRGPYRVTSKGRDYWYAWKGRGAPRLPGKPGSDEFLVALGRAREARHGTSSNDRIGGLVRAYQASPEWKKNAETTKKLWGRWLSKIDLHFGDLRVSVFNRAEIRADIYDWRNTFQDTPRAADTAIQVFSRLLSFAIDNGKLTTNPCAGISKLYQGDRADIIWTDDELNALKDIASVELMWTARMAVLTGLRQADVVSLKWSEIKSDHIAKPTAKSRGRIIAIIPLYDELQTLLDEVPKRSLNVLTNTFGDPWKSGLSDWFGEQAEKAGVVGKTFNDLRGTAATNLYRLGFKMREIAEMMAWSEAGVEKIIRRYVGRNVAVKDRIRRLNENDSKTKSEKLRKNRSQKSG